MYSVCDISHCHSFSFSSYCKNPASTLPPFSLLPLSDFPLLCELRGKGRSHWFDVTQHLVPTPPKSQQIHFIRNAKTVFYLRGHRTNTVCILSS